MTFLRKSLGMSYRFCAWSCLGCGNHAPSVSEARRLASPLPLRPPWRASGVAALLGGWLAVVATMLSPSHVHGELVVEETDDPQGRLTTYRMTVSPAAEPSPALKHRLTLRETDLLPGNAAPYYYRALMGVSRTGRLAVEKFGETYHEWIEIKTPLASLPLEKLRSAAELWHGGVMDNLRQAAVRRDCDWDWNSEEIRGRQVIEFHLEEVQEARALSRALLLQARLALAEGRTDDALDCLRLNYRLAVDVAREPILVCDLVGIAIASHGHSQLIELISQPGAPNLYWALSELPRPLVNTRKSVRFETSIALRVFPFLMDAETAEHSPEEWSRLITQSVLDLDGLGILGPSGAQRGMAETGVAAVSLVVYPSAKRRLVEGGMDPERVERMPVGQVVAIDALREYRRIADEVEKWNYLPYQTVRRRPPVEPWGTHGTGPATLTQGYGYALAAFVLPATAAVRNAEERLLWLTEALCVVESIRMHAARTGALPATLDAIDVVPAPENPATGEPFVYRLEKGVGVLELPFSDGFAGVAYRFEITLDNR